MRFFCKSFARYLIVGCSLWFGFVPAVFGVQNADLVVTGKIVTMAEKRPVVSGFAVKGGKLIYVGKAEIARRQLAPHGRLINLRLSQIVLPGLIDSHIHMLDAAWMRQTCVLEEPKTKEQLLATIAEYDRSHPNPAWVIGSGWPVTL
jgi:predicted amidohydrolase YtcJ